MLNVLYILYLKKVFVYYIPTMAKVYERLYIKDSRSRTRCYQLSVVENVDTGNVHIKGSTGISGGKMTLNERIVSSGKNIGKSNETTVWDQAIKEADSTFRIQQSIGYSTSPTHTPIIKPMLAHPYFDSSGNPDKNKEKHIQLPFCMQPKIDGVRMLVGKQLDGTAVVMSRTGKPVYNMNHISDEIMPHLTDGDFIDGEIFTFDMTFEEITGICRTSKNSDVKDKKCEAIKFHVFDYFNLKFMDWPFSIRSERLKALSLKTKNSFCVPTTILHDKSSIQHTLDQYIQDGFEGGMIRNVSSVYKLDSRSNDLLKAKYFVTDEYEIVGFTEATGRDQGTVIWVCQVPGGFRNDGQYVPNTIFRVRPRGSIECRREYFEHAIDYMGKMLTVQYQNLTNKGHPRFPVGLAIRDYE